MSSREHSVTNQAGRVAVKVLVVDDHAAVREGLLRLLKSTNTIWGEIVAVGSLQEARQAALLLQPDLVLLDVDMAGEDGLSLIADLPCCSRVLVLSSHGDAFTRERALRMGAEALVDKRAPGQQLLAQIVRFTAPDSRGDQAPVAIGS